MPQGSPFCSLSFATPNWDFEGIGTGALVGGLKWFGTSFLKEMPWRLAHWNPCHQLDLGMALKLHGLLFVAASRCGLGYHGDLGSRKWQGSSFAVN